MKCSWVEPRLSVKMTLSKVDQIVKVTHLRKYPFGGCESMGTSGLKALLLGFYSSGSQHNHLSLQVYFSEFFRLPDLAPLIMPLPPALFWHSGFGSLLAGMLTLRASLSHTLYQPLVYLVYLAADCQLQGGPSLLLCLGLLCTTAH